MIYISISKVCGNKCAYWNKLNYIETINVSEILLQIQDKNAINHCPILWILFLAAAAALGIYIQQNSERRYDPLTFKWVAFSLRII